MSYTSHQMRIAPSCWSDGAAKDNCSEGSEGDDGKGNIQGIEQELSAHGEPPRPNSPPPSQVELAVAGCNRY